MRNRLATSIATIAMLGAALTACSSTGGSNGQAATNEQIDAALKKPATISVWGWDASLPVLAKSFMKKYPSVTVKVSNPQNIYDGLIRALQSGKGGPDVSYMNYSDAPSFAQTGGLADLDKYGLNGLQSKFQKSVWDQSKVDGKLYTIPWTSGALTFWYNKKLYDQYGLTVPTTWDELVEQGAKLKKENPGLYLLDNGGGEAYLTQSLLWQAGAAPYSIKGDHIKIDLTNAKAQKWAEMWDKLVAEDALAPGAQWSQDWYSGLENGKILSLVSGVWMGSILQSSLTKQSGEWRVADVPVYTKGSPLVTGELGGAGYAMTKQSKHPLVAAGFLRYMSTTEGQAAATSIGSVPTIKALLDSSDFLNAENPFFGNQKVNKVIADASAAVVPGWQWLPFNTYATSIFPDTVGQAFANKSPIQAGLEQWQAQLKQYAQRQGFKVE